MPSSKKPSLMRSLGLFVHNVAQGLKPGPKNRIEVNRDVQEKKLETPQGEVTLRRTTIDEVEVKRNG